MQQAWEGRLFVLCLVWPDFPFSLPVGWAIKKKKKKKVENSETEAHGIHLQEKSVKFVDLDIQVLSETI